jgi:hypothetical protein
MESSTGTGPRGDASRSGRDVLSVEHGASYKTMASTNGTHFEFVLRVQTAEISHLYPNVREALVGVGYELTEMVDVMRVLERLIAASIDRDAKRLHVRVHTSPRRTRIKVIDRRRLNPSATLPSDIASREIARTWGARPVKGGAGLELWAIVDRRRAPDGPYTA